MMERSSINTFMSSSSSSSQSDHDETMNMAAEDLRRGPWTVEEDLKLVDYIATHGEGRWNSLARCAGLKRTGKSCRLRWLNYLRPDVRRGNITLEEQLMILELHSRWGNRWSKIAQHLPGRTDNEIKNYWRTRVQKHAKQLKCDVNSKQFKDTMRYLWMPRLIERIQAASAASSSATASSAATQQHNPDQVAIPSAVTGVAGDYGVVPHYCTPENSASIDSAATQVSPASDFTGNDYYNISVNQNSNQDYFQAVGGYDTIISPSGYFNHGLPEFHGVAEEQSNGGLQQWFDGGDATDSLWNAEDNWYLQQLNNNINI